MWYEIILLELFTKYNLQQEEAHNFVSHFFLQFRQCFEPGEPIPLEIYLGIIDKTVYLLNEKKIESVTLEKMARMLFGLLIIYVKSADENTIWTSDFRHFLECDVIYSALNCEEIIQESENSVLSLYSKKPTAQTILDESREIGEIDCLKRLEQQLLKHLNFQLKIDFERLLNFFSTLNDKTQLNAMYFDHLNLLGVNENFDDFMAQINRIREKEYYAFGHCCYRVSDTKFKSISDLKFSQNDTNFYILLKGLKIQLNELSGKAQGSAEVSDEYFATLQLEYTFYDVFFSYLPQKNLQQYQRFKSSCFEAIETASLTLTSFAWQETLIALTMACIRMETDFQEPIYSGNETNKSLFHSPLIKSALPGRCINHTSLTRSN